MRSPRVFVSYAWEDDIKVWVRKLADRLISDGIDAYIDQYDLNLGDRLPQFMEEQIIFADYVLIICTPEYKNRADARIGGAGYEGHIISAELMNHSNERKFIPVKRKGTFYDAMPTFLSGKLGIDLSIDGEQYETNYKDLITTILGKNKKPVLNIQESVHMNDKNSDLIEQKKDEPIHILGIITDEVTLPSMDGTKGCALYSIPFRLSRNPSELWKKLFLQAWKFPSSFTSMHRSDIARIYDDEIILDGTTIEEVRDYHRKTLILCVEEANKQEQIIIEKQRQQQELEERRIKEHFSKVTKIAENINF